MKRILTAVAVLVASALSLLATPVGEKCEHLYLKHGGLDREFYLYRPADLKTGAPLILVLHGYGKGGALSQPGEFMDLADANGFAVCYVQGWEERPGAKSWNVGYDGQVEIGYKVDDVDFLCKLAKHLQKTYGLSKENTFLTGMSNGGEMCYLMAMKRPDAFAAIASVAGLTLERMDRNYRKPVPFMEVHGTEDIISYWKGYPTLKGSWGPYLAVPTAVSYLIAVDRCRYMEEEEITPRSELKVVLHKHKGGLPAWKGGPECEVWLYEIIGGGHGWNEKRLDTYSEIWRFFKQYLR